MRCVLATSNEHKREEIAAIVESMGVHGITFVSLRDYPDIPPAVEDGATFAENARIKALHVSSVTGGWALADDSGLVVDALDGRPGIHSARYAGDHATDADRVAKLLGELSGVPTATRTARFACHMALTHGGRVHVEAEGVCEGVIADAPSGEHGFGYDPIMWLPDLECTVAELSADGKNRISHRAQAIRGLKQSLMDIVAPPRA
jgi:XTP/dITP diphosphohydrolase